MEPISFALALFDNAVQISAQTAEYRSAPDKFRVLNKELKFVRALSNALKSIPDENVQQAEYAGMKKELIDLNSKCEALEERLKSIQQKYFPAESSNVFLKVRKKGHRFISASDVNR